MDDVDLDRRDRAVLNAYQGGFPVTARPFEPAAAALRARGVDVTASELLARIRDLDERGVVSRFGPLVNADAIGGTATLVALHAPPDRFDAVAERVNDHREVTHNYRRDHPHLTMWFVVSVADPAKVDDVLAAIEAETGQRTYNLPKRREFHLGARFPVDGPLHDAGVDLTHLGPAATPSDRATLTPRERDLVLEVQDGLPLTATPYADVAEAVGTDRAWVLRTLNRFLAEGKLRRVGIVPNHYALGYTENAMTVWNVPDETVDEVGTAVGELDFVTHCYERPRHGDVWPYNLFAMTHGRSDAESERRIETVRTTVETHVDVADDDWQTLFSTAVLKKTGIRLDHRAAANTEP